MLKARLDSAFEFALSLFSSMKAVRRRDDGPRRCNDLKTPVRLILEGVSISNKVEVERIEL